MKYFVPLLEPAKEFNAQAALMEKFGGLPFGLRTEMYPICGKCENPMSLLAQLIHEKERLDLGKEGRVLFVFQCSSPACPTWEADSGSNACFVTESEDITDSVEKLPLGDLSLDKEFWIAGWQELDDEVSEEECVYFLNAEKYESLDEETAEEVFNKIVDVSKLGSVPSWIQYPEIPEGNWKFVGQLDGDTGFNFGDAGIGYIFIERIEDPLQLPKGKFFWQCG